MLKVECLNNSLWNHLDKIIVVAIVKEPESDRMRQKKEGEEREKKKRQAPECLSPEGRYKVERSPAPLFSVCLCNLEGLHLTTEHPPLAARQKWTPGWKRRDGDGTPPAASSQRWAGRLHPARGKNLSFTDCLPGKSRTVAPALC